MNCVPVLVTVLIFLRVVCTCQISFILSNLTSWICWRYEQGPPGSYNYPPAQSRLEKFPPGSYSSGQVPMKAGMRPYFGDHSEGYGTPYGVYWFDDYCWQFNFIMVALCNSAHHYIFALWFLSFSSSSIFFFYSLPNLSGRRLDVYHTSTHGMALVRI